MDPHMEQNLRGQIADLETRLAACQQTLDAERAAHREEVVAAQTRFDLRLVEIENKAVAKLRREQEIKELEARLAALKATAV